MTNEHIALTAAGTEVILTKEQLDAITTIDLNIKKLETVISSPAALDYIHAWRSNGWGVKYANGTTSVVPVWFATAIDSCEPLRKARGGYTNGANETTEIICRGELAEAQIDETRKLRETLIAQFQKMNAEA